MRPLIALVLTGVLVMTLAAPVLAQEEVPTLGVHGVLADGSPITAELDRTDGMHLYVFEGTNGSTVTLSMTKTDGDIDPLVILLRQNGRVEAWNDDGGGDLNSRLQWTLLESGLYFVLATTPRELYFHSEEDEIEGSYRIEISGAATPSADLELDPALLQIPRVELDTSLQGALDERQSVFMAWLNVQDSIVVDLSAPSSEADTLMYVFDVEGRRIAIDDDGGTDGLSAFVPGLPLTEPGQYLIMVTTFGFHEVNEYGQQGGVFNLNVSRGS